MPTLIRVNYGGRKIRRCDARCYDDHQHQCQCICGGVNHGVGLRQALLNTAAIAEKHLHDSEASLFHSMTPELLDTALQFPEIIKPLVLLTPAQIYQKEGG